MARNINNLLTQNYSGKVGDEIVLKDFRGKTIATKKADRSGVKLSVKQQKSNELFQKAVAYGKELVNDPERKAELNRKLSSNAMTANISPYNAAIQQFMRSNSPKVRMARAEEVLDLYASVFQMTERQADAVKYLAVEKQLSNAAYQNLNKVSKATATRDLQDMVRRGIIAVSGRGAGAKYALLPLPLEAGDDWLMEDI